MSEPRLFQSPGRRAMVALWAGGLQTASLAPLGWWPLQILALAGLFWLVRDAAPRRAAVVGWCFGLGWLSTGLWWLYISLHDFGGLPMPVAALAVLLLAGILALYPALAMALHAGLRVRWLGSDRQDGPGGRAAAGLLFSACWLLAELARGQWFSGFPWAASGYAHTDGPLAALAPWVGVYGMCAASALLAAALTDAIRAWYLPAGQGAGGWSRLGWWPALAVLPVLAAALAPSEFTRSTGPLEVSLLQPNVPQDVKFDPARVGENMQALREQLLAARGRLVLTPESVVPVPQAHLAPDYWASLVAPFTASAADGAGRAALIGTFLGDDEQGYVNSLAGVSAATPRAAQGEFYAYGKHHLLPFGEYVPPGLHWFVAMMNIPLGDQARGRSEALFALGGQRIRPLICYEDLFGEEFAASTLGPQGATVLANASNLAWFGRWMMQDQHLQFSRMRALEFQRPLVRATNTGATAAIDHHGAVVARLPAWQAGTLDVVVDGRLGDTPYARWVAAFGLLPAWGLVLLLGGFAFLLGAPLRISRV